MCKEGVYKLLFYFVGKYIRVKNELNIYYDFENRLWSNENLKFSQIEKKLWINLTTIYFIFSKIINSNNIIKKNYS